ncbi:MAG: type II toxin-antitoxin system VapC family toxin [Vicinamibacteria bacterium]
MRLVVDASVAIKWLLDEIGSQHARHFLERFRIDADELIAPDLILSEIGNALRSAAVLRKRIPADIVAGIFDDFLRIGVPTRGAAETAQKALELALEHDATFYDAAYVALALEEGIPVLTVDGPMVHKFKGVVEFVMLQTEFTDPEA